MGYYPPPQPGYAPVPPQPPQQTHTMAVVSIIFGILGLVGACPGLGSIIAVITGNMAKNDIRLEPYRYSGDGLAKGGVILGWVGIALMACGLCGFLVWLFAFGGLAILGAMSEQGWLPLASGLWA